MLSGYGVADGISLDVRLCGTAIDSEVENGGTAIVEGGLASNTQVDSGGAARWLTAAAWRSSAVAKIPMLRSILATVYRSGGTAIRAIVLGGFVVVGSRPRDEAKKSEALGHKRRSRVSIPFRTTDCAEGPSL